MANLSWQLALDVWREIVDGFLVQGGRCCNLRKGETPRQLIGGYLLHRLGTHKPYIHGLLAPRIHAQRQGIGFDEHVAHETDVYTQLLLRRVTLTNQRTTVDGRPDLTNIHRLLLVLVPYLSLRPDWLDPRMVRLPGEPKFVLGDDIQFRGLAAVLRRLFHGEQRRHRLAREEKDAKWGFGPNSASPSWIEGRFGNGDPRPDGTWGTLHLQVGDMLVPVPEELGLADAFDCLPGPLRRELMDEFRDGLVNVLGTGADEDDAADQAVTAAEKRLGDALPQGYRIWRLFRKVVEDLNDPYGAMIAAGIPSAVMFTLDPEFRQRRTFGECEFLEKLRQQAHAEAAKRGGAEVEEQDWEEAWSVLEADGDMTGTYAKSDFGGFDDFRHTREGHALLNLRLEVIADGDETGGEEGRGVHPSVEAEADREDIQRLMVSWGENRRMTNCELFVTEAATSLGPDRRDKRFSLFSDQAFCAEAESLTLREIPYNLIPEPGSRLEVLRFFYERRIWLLQGYACRRQKKGWARAAFVQGHVPMTEAEQMVLIIVRDLNDRAGNPSRESARLLQVEILARLKTDAMLAKALNTFPYKLVPEGDRLKLMLFFYTRDVEGSLVRPEYQ